MGLSYRAARILERLHATIRTRGQDGLSGFRARLHEQWLDGKREATEKHFVAIVGGDGGVLSAEEAGLLFRELGGKDTSIPFAEIFRALRPPTTCQRAALTRAVFDMIDQDRDGLLSLDQISVWYQAPKHPDVRRGLRTSTEVRQDFLHTLFDVISVDAHSNGRAMVSFPSFLDFYCSLTALTNDDDFRDAIVAVWVPPVAFGNEDIPHTHGAAGGLVANLRSQILAKGLPGVVAFCRGVRKIAVGGQGDTQDITQEHFQAAASLAGAKLTTSEMTQAFRHLDRRGVGRISMIDALRAVRGEVNTRRADVIDDTFDALLFRGDHESGRGGQDSQTLEPLAISKLFCAEEHPDVVSGARSQGEVSSEFLESFDGGGEIGGRVSRAEWREHHSNVSALIPDDDAFCGHVKRVWGCDDGNNIVGDISKSSHNGLQRNLLDGVQNSPTRDSESAVGDARESGGNLALANSNSDCQGHHGHRVGTVAAPPVSREARALSSRPASTTEGSTTMNGGIPRAATSTKSSIPPGILGILSRVRSSLASGGMRAAFTLLRGFREGDQEGGGKVNLAAFKRAVNGAARGLKEVELRIIFQHFDEGGDGEVGYEQFLRHIRETLPEGRLALANKVFDRMDADGNGLVSVDDVALNFKASAHPEVVEGSREEEDVRREFLESFPVANGSHKWCTRDDIIWWMELLSSSLPTTPSGDVSFETLVRACWGMPADPVGGSGSQANNEKGDDTSMNVVVTHADGSMSIERVPWQAAGVQSESGDRTGGDDLLVTQMQAEEIRRHLFVRGVHAVHVHLLKNFPAGTAHATHSGTRITAQEGLFVNNAGGLLDSKSPRSLLHDGLRPSFDEVRVARFGPSGDSKGNEGGGRFEEGDPGISFDHGLRSVLQVARKRVALRGTAGFFSLSKRLRSAGYFRAKVASSSQRATVAAAAAAAAAASCDYVGIDSRADTTESGPFVSLEGFKEALSEVGCGLDGKDLTAIFAHLDTRSLGEIPVEMALEAIRGRLTGTRLSLVRAAFTRLQGSGGGPPDATAAVNVAFQYDPAGHPEVIACRRAPEDVRKEFMDALTTTEGFVTRTDFESYYSDVSAATPSDGYFALLVRACWGLGQAAAASAASTTVAIPGAMAAGGTNVRLNGDHDPAITRRTYSKARTSAPLGVLPGTAARSDIAASTVAARAVARRGLRGGVRTPTAGVAAILRKLGTEVQGHGVAWGLAGLRRALLEADRDKDGFLSFGDLKAALSSSRAGLTTPEVRALFAHLETEGGPRRAGGGGGDASGVAPWQALLDATRPCLSGERLALVRLAFGKMDKNGQGHVSPETVTRRFAASRHPAVLRGQATEGEVLRELLDTFFSEGAGEDGLQVTEDDFIEHHANLSFGFKSNADFRELVINCWGLDGIDTGRDGRHCVSAEVVDELRRANAPRRTFLVSYADGSQCVEELPFSSKAEDEASLTSSEERVLKKELLKRDNIHATQVAFLPRTCRGAAPSLSSENTHSFEMGNSKEVDRRPAWTWAPMNIKEIQDANAACATVANPNGDEESGGRSQPYGTNDAPVSADHADRIENTWSSVGQSVKSGTDEGLEVDWEGEEGDGGGAGGRARQRMRAGGRRLPAGQGREADLSVRYLISKLRSELNSHGVAEVANLSRRLREMSVSLGSKVTSSHHGIGEVDFRQALREADIPLTESDIRRVFAHFEMGQSGVMNLEALMDRLSGRMDHRRAVLVDEAFNRLDTSSQGYIMLDQVIDTFNATKHPDVMSGRQAPDSVFRDFVDGFVAGFSPGRRDSADEDGAKITKEDFRRYYDLVSATVPDDGFFELLLKSCWHMAGSGGTTTTTDGGASPSPGSLTTRDCGARKDDLAQQRKQEPGRRHSFGPSRRHFHSSKDAATGGPRIGNDHFSTPPVFLPPNEGREQSFNSLKESRAAGSGHGGRSSVGPSDENRILRSAMLSRTFGSQIFFGGSEGESEAPRRFRSPSHTEGEAERPPPPPAGGGRMGRVAEGAAWTPGGRRLIPGSTVFTSHLGSGMMAENLEGGVGDGLRLSENNSGAPGASAAREPPVWIPKLGPKTRRTITVAVGGDGSGENRGWHSARNAGREKLAQDRKCAVTMRATGCNPSGEVSLAKFMSSSEELAPGQGMDQSQPDNGVPATRRQAVAVGRNRTCSFGDEDERGRPAVCTINRSEERGKFDWWGGAGASDLGIEPASGSRGWRAEGGRAFEHRPTPVSDTYKSSLVFG